MNYAVEQRLRLIDFLLAHYGHINRAALCEFFGIAVAQATRDLTLYRELAPSNMVYNVTEKYWIKSREFERLYL